MTADKANKKALIEKENSFRQSFGNGNETGKDEGSAKVAISGFACWHPWAHRASCLSFRFYAFFVLYMICCRLSMGFFTKAET